MSTETYLSVDIEADGPIPGPHSMLSLGAAAFTAEGELLDSFSINLETLPGATSHPEQAAWWEKFPEALAAARVDPVEPGAAMQRFETWLQTLPGTPVFVGWPAGFDFTFVYWYLRKFLDRSPLSFASLDIKTYAMAMRGSLFVETVKRKLPRSWMSDPRPGHVALNDALMQGEMFCNMLAERRDWPGLRGAALVHAEDPESGLSFELSGDQLRLDLVLPGLSVVRRVPVDRDDLVEVAKVLGRVASKRDADETLEIASSLHLQLRRVQKQIGLRVRFVAVNKREGAIETEFDLDPRSVGVCAQQLRDAARSDDRASDPPWI